jgi:hypothetical protein
LTGFCKSKVCSAYQRIAAGFAKTISIRLPADSILFTKTLLLQTLFQGRVATTRTNEAHARFDIF